MIRPTRLFRTAARTRSDVKLQPDVTSFREELLETNIKLEQERY